MGIPEIFQTAVGSLKVQSNFVKTSVQESTRAPPHNLADFLSALVRNRETKVRKVASANLWERNNDKKLHGAQSL